MVFASPDISVQINEDHEQLTALTASVRAFVDKDASPPHHPRWKLYTLARLRDFHNQLAKHFDLEEEGGFFEEMLRLSPHAAHDIEEFIDDHYRILHDLRRLINELKGTGPEDRSFPHRLRRELGTLLGRLRNHEAREAELLYDAHFQVFGAGD